jgi:hypothetical protein
VHCTGRTSQFSNQLALHALEGGQANRLLPTLTVSTSTPVTRLRLRASAAPAGQPTGRPAILAGPIRLPSCGA